MWFAVTKSWLIFCGKTQFTQVRWTEETMIKVSTAHCQVTSLITRAMVMVSLRTECLFVFLRMRVSSFENLKTSSEDALVFQIS